MKRGKLLHVRSSPHWRGETCWCKGLYRVSVGSRPYRRFALWVTSLDLHPEQPVALLAIQHAVKVACKLMSRPTSRAWEMLKRIGRYLKGKPRLIWKYGW